MSARVVAAARLSSRCRGGPATCTPQASRSGGARRPSPTPSAPRRARRCCCCCCASRARACCRSSSPPCSLRPPGRRRPPSCRRAAPRRSSPYLPTHCRTCRRPSPRLAAPPPPLFAPPSLPLLQDYGVAGMVLVASLPLILHPVIAFGMLSGASDASILGSTAGGVCRPPFVSEDRAPSASLGRLKLRPRLRIPGAPPEQVASASRLRGRPTVEDVGPPSTARHHPVWAHAQVPHQSARSQASTPARSRPSPARPHAFAAPCATGQWPT